MAHNPRPLWPILVAVLIGAPLLYVASFGPAARLAQEGLLNEKLFQLLYTRLGILIPILPDSAGRALLHYAAFCGVKFN